jgi:hypothetical protein
MEVQLLHQSDPFPRRACLKIAEFVAVSSSRKFKRKRRMDRVFQGLNFSVDKEIGQNK